MQIPSNYQKGPREIYVKTSERCAWLHCSLHGDQSLYEITHTNTSVETAIWTVTQRGSECFYGCKQTHKEHLTDTMLHSL
jgi:hypothetical protein